jgi:hypothetical protein
MDTARCVPLSGLIVGAATCPKVGVAAAASNVADKRELRRCTFMLRSLSWVRRQLPDSGTPLRVRLKGPLGVYTWPVPEATLAASGVSGRPAAERWP